MQHVQIVALRLAETLSEFSICKRYKVGAVITKNGKYVACGYNGPLSDEVCNVCTGPGCKISQHAEIMAIKNARRRIGALSDCTLLTTLSPCINCAKAIVIESIKLVYYLKEYRDESGIEYLKSKGVEVIKWQV
jgi:dCMP deaminase